MSKFQVGQSVMMKDREHNPRTSYSYPAVVVGTPKDDVLGEYELRVDDKYITHCKESMLIETCYDSS